MKITSLGISFLTASLIASLSLAMGGKPALPEKKWDPSVQGIRLGSRYQEVVSTFGKPRSRKDREGKFFLTYDGLMVEIDRSNKGSQWVSRIEITGSKWQISPEINVGMPKDDVITVLGAPLHQEERDDGKLWIWWWHGNPKFDSLFSVTFEKGKAVSIIVSEDNSLLCRRAGGLDQDANEAGTRRRAGSSA